MTDDKLIIKSKKRLHGEDGYKVFSIRVREEVVNKIDAVAEKSGRSRNELIGIFLEYAVDRCEIEQE